jgi:PKD repeat protein
MIGYECRSHWYWTGTEVPNDNTQAYGFFVSYMGFWLNHGFPKGDKLCVTAVRGPGAQPPRACFNESATSTSVCNSIDFYPDCSSDPDGDIVLYEWDFNSDGIVDQTTTTPETVSHSFDSPGIYTVTLTVTDDDNLTDTFWEIKIVWPSQPPVACFTESATMVIPGETIDFYPNCSYDPDGDIVLYQWDFDGDGTIDHESTSPDPVSHTYGERGAYTVTLRVEDRHGLNDTFTTTKYVDIPVVVDGDDGNDWPVVGSIVAAYVILILLVAVVWQMRKRGPGTVGPK